MPSAPRVQAGFGIASSRAAQRVERGVGLGVAVAQARELQPVAGNVADAHDRVAGDRRGRRSRNGGPLRLAAAIENASPRPSSSLDRLLQLRGEARARATTAKASTRRGEGASATSAKSPSIRGSPSGRSQATQDLRFAGEEEIGAIERGARAGEFAGELALSRWVQRRRPTRCSEAVSTEKNSSSRMTRPLMSAANGSSSASGPPPRSALRRAGRRSDSATTSERARRARRARGRRASRPDDAPRRSRSLVASLGPLRPSRARPPPARAPPPIVLLLPPRRTESTPPDLRKAAEKVVNRIVAAAQFATSQQ